MCVCTLTYMWSSDYSKLCLRTIFCHKMKKKWSKLGRPTKKNGQWFGKRYKTDISKILQEGISCSSCYDGHSLGTCILTWHLTLLLGYAGSECEPVRAEEASETVFNIVLLLLFVLKLSMRNTCSLNTLSAYWFLGKSASWKPTPLR